MSCFWKVIGRHMPTRPAPQITQCFRYFRYLRSQWVEVGVWAPSMGNLSDHHFRVNYSHTIGKDQQWVEIDRVHTRLADYI